MLLAYCFLKLEKDIYDELWDNNIEIAQKTLKTQFLQHMQLGDLQADEYVKFMIQDIKYLVMVTEMLKEMYDKVKEPDLREFMKDRYNKYSDIAEKTLKEFNLNSALNINLIDVMEKYLSKYKDIMDKEKPIFFAVALLPCTRLWLWVANQLTESYCNAYFTWKKNNMYGNPEKYRKLLNEHLTKEEDKKKAKEIFQQQMQYEYDFFASSLK
ncbi:hypothetical protein ACER0C_003599 [Sarotherodon galilaeus]